jgi:HEAT repeat protein
VPALVTTLRDPEFTSYPALRALGKIGPGARIAVPELNRMLKDKNPVLRIVGAMALLEVGETKAGLPLIVRLLESGTGLEKWAIWDMTLSRIGPKGKAAAPLVAELLKNENDEVRTWASVVHGQMGPDAVAAVPALIAALKDGNDQTREGAAEVLGQIGPSARAALPSLLAALKDRNEKVRELAAAALHKIDPQTGKAGAK